MGRVAGGGYRRRSFAGADLELREWFAAAAGQRGLSCEVDPFGNLAAWWRPADAGTGPGVLTGSHLDSVVDGGAYDGLLGVVSAIAAQGTARSQRDGTELVVTLESVSPAAVLDPALAGRIGAGRDWPVVPTAAEHGAGVLDAAGVPAAMLFVRNPTGVSHSPAEHADLADCLVGVQALADTLARLAV